MKCSWISSPNSVLDLRTLERRSKLATPTLLLCQASLTFPVWLEVPIHGGWFTVCNRNWSSGRGLWAGPEAHVSRRGNLHSKWRKIKRPWGHWHIVCFLNWFRKTAGMLSWRRVGIHWDIIFIQFFTWYTSHRQYIFDFLKHTHTFLLINKTIVKQENAILSHTYSYGCEGTFITTSHLVSGH